MEYDYKAAAHHLLDMRRKVRDMKMKDRTYQEIGLPELSKDENPTPKRTRIKKEERANL